MESVCQHDPKIAKEARMNRLGPVLVALFTALPAFAQDVSEPKSGIRFAEKDGNMSLLGVGLRKKAIMKVYAIGLYVADSTLSGALKGKAGTPELYREIASGDFKKKVVLKFVRDLNSDQLRGAFRDALKGAGSKSEVWLGYFGDIRQGQECSIGWTPGTGLETKIAGLGNAPLNDKVLASAIFEMWLGDKPVQDDLKLALVSRARELIK
jgi:hypothetical protein